MKKITVYKSLPLIATFLFSFDNLIFVQSRIAILDIFTLTFMLIGFYWYFSGHTYLSAIGMALSTLTKATGGAGIIVIVALHTARFIRDNLGKGKWNELFSWFEKYLIVYVASFLIILAVLDVQWVGFSNPVDHIRFILDYSSRLTSTCPSGIISCPWQWLINQIPIPYLTVNVDVTSGNVTRSFQSIAFVGAMNPAILFLTIPAMLYLAYDCYKKKGDYSLFILIWFSITYLPYYPAVLAAQRVTYLFYFLMTMPAVCAGVAYMISEQNPPKLVVLFYLAVVVVSFYWMFPFKVIP
jgi:predicted membrane-bound dolichyl-phosphate-mannose-protein mannosyltransferase